jgi:hypothetical protein
MILQLSEAAVDGSTARRALIVRSFKPCPVAETALALVARVAAVAAVALEPVAARAGLAASSRC